MTDDSAFKKQIRARMAETGENYTTARRLVIAAHDPGQRNMANRLLGDHIEMAGAEGAGVAVGSEIVTIQDLHIDQNADAINRRISRAAGITTIAVWPDMGHVRIEIQADRQSSAAAHSEGRWPAEGAERNTNGPGH